MIAVFGVSPEACDRAVRHARAGAPDVPVWLFANCTPFPETAGLCERVNTGGNSLSLLWRAECALWPHRVALAVGTWTEQRGGYILRLAPFLVPPFRTLLMNSQGDFFAGSPAAVLLHLRRSWADSAASRWQALGERVAACRQWMRRRTQRAGHWLRATGFSALGWVLRWCGYPHRRWFHRLHGNERLSADVGRTPSSARDPLVALPPAVHAPRFVVWTRNGESADIAAFLPLFQDDRTFAVSLQSDFRAWKPGLMPTAAFRALQPGEASQVLAPLGRTIVADRGKLAVLGMPDCAAPETAWLLLFWKAAAAGWRSYSVADTAPVAEQPDLPSAEAEFFWHFLTRPELRRLGPAGEDLSRGVIAFQPGIQPNPPRAGCLRVLLVSPFLPFPLSHGGAVRIYNLCRALADRVEFLLIAIREKQEEVRYQDLARVFRDVRVVDLDEPPSTNPDEPEQVRHSQSRSLRAAIREMARIHQPDLLQIEYTHLAEYRPDDLGIPAILVEHDLTWTLYRQIAEQERTPESLRELESWQRFERRQLRTFDAIWTVSEEDRQIAISEGSHAESTFAIPNGVDLERFHPFEAAAQPGPQEVLFVGSFRHLPNVLGFEKLLREVMPRVWEHLPDVRVRVVGGPQHDLYWGKFRPNAAPFDSRIALHGFVEDLRPLYRAATVVVVPLPVSAGTNIKVLEAMACGKAIVTTPVGCGGLDLESGHDALICSGWPEFGAALCELLRDAELRGRIGSRARRTVEERFGWNSIADRAFESYTAMLNQSAERANGSNPLRRITSYAASTDSGRT